MILSTTHNLEGYTITEYLGVVTAHGGWQQSPQNALKSLGVAGEKLGADAVIGIQIGQLADSVQAYGTAVKLG